LKDRKRLDGARRERRSDVLVLVLFFGLLVVRPLVREGVDCLRGGLALGFDSAVDGVHAN
jgi:hypothetical protein